jgi:hypothetical protein
VVFDSIKFNNYLAGASHHNKYYVSAIGEIGYDEILGILV